MILLSNKIYQKFYHQDLKKLFQKQEIVKDCKRTIKFAKNR